MTLFWMLTVAGVFYVALVVVSPHRKCRRCQGRGVTRRRHWWSKPRRPRRCPKCRGHREHQRFGAGTVHRAVQSLRAARRVKKEN